MSVRSASHPVSTIKSQLANPPAHAIMQVPPAQVGVPFTSEQASPHPPQFAASVASVDSQPSVPSVLQSPTPAWHVSTTHALASQCAVATPLLAAQSFPHVPQLSGSTRRSIPSSVIPSQSSSTPLQSSRPSAQASPAASGGGTP